MAKKQKPNLKLGESKSTVTTYEHFRDVKECLASGWSCEYLREYLTQRYGSHGVPGLRALQRWKAKNMPTAKIIPSHIIDDKLKGVDYQVDIIKHMSRYVFLLEDRFLRWWDKEEKLDLVMPQNDGPSREYREAMGQWLKAAQDLGIVRAPPMPVIDMRTQNINLPPEILENLLKTAAEIKRIKEEG